MAGITLPALRLPSPRGENSEQSGTDAPLVDLPPSNKFGFAWPAEFVPATATSVSAPSFPSAEHGVVLSSSETESGYSDSESVAGDPVENANGINTLVAEPEDFSDYTPTSELTMEKGVPSTPLTPSLTIPRLTRAFSAPLPSQLGYLRNPRRPTPLVLTDTSSSPDSDVPFSPTTENAHEFSLELADTVQMIVQTMLQLSPPQLFDPAKEQYAGCALTIPTPSMSAMLTSMKNLNYMSANMSTFSSPSASRTPSSRSFSATRSNTLDNFDIGEMLQSVGDAISGIAAQADVEIVLYHGDVGLKHVFVKGDECGISYTLLHVIRQVISTAQQGDTIEIGLYVSSSPSTYPEESTSADPDLSSSPSLTRSSSPEDPDGPLRCTFDIAHKFATPELVTPDTAETPLADDDFSLPPPSRPEPPLEGQILQRLLKHVGATLVAGLPPRSFPIGRVCEVSLILDRGTSSSNSPAPTKSIDEESLWQSEGRVKLAKEPALEDLMLFVESLRGKKVALYASAKGSFAHHLTSYLTAWGLDVSHMSAEGDLDGAHSRTHSILTIHEHEDAGGSSPRPTDSGYVASTTLPNPALVGLGIDGYPIPLPTSQDDVTTNQSATPGSGTSGSGYSFIVIDDDLNVLRRRLVQYRAELMSLNLRSRKRPTLTSNQRARSSSHVARAMGGTAQQSPIVIVYFTSLAKYKLVKDVMQSNLPSPNALYILPEVIVIPKPAGPRRFLTALHTAVTKPVVDPFFSPIATSPSSPGLHPDYSPYFPVSRRQSSARPSATPRTNSDRSQRSPKDFLMEPANLLPPSPLGMSDGMEYFAEAAVQLGSSPSSGLVIQSPDGQPAGIFFHPRSRNSKPGSLSPTILRDRAQLIVPGDRRGSLSGDRDSPTNTRRASGGRTRASPRLQAVPEILTQNMNYSVHPPSPGVVAGRRTPKTSPFEERPPSVSTPPSIPHLPSSPTTVIIDPSRIITAGDSGRKSSGSLMSPRSATPTASTRRMSRRATIDNKATTPPVAQKKGKGTGDNNIVPPINVLIVEDNPINQTILSTFMRRKKIKYDVAKNGLEAVEKWRTGSFHLILMDIQMPVMDGIQATKEIRRMEKAVASNGFPVTPQGEGRATPSEHTSSSDSRPSSVGAGTPFRSSVIIVALTASSLQSDRVAALAAGCNDFLTKPVSLDWLNSKIIEWGSIKALQMWADLRPEVVKNLVSGQVAQAKSVASKLHVPEGRSSPVKNRSRAASPSRRSLSEIVSETPVSASAPPQQLSSESTPTNGPPLKPSGTTSDVLAAVMGLATSTKSVYEAPGGSLSAGASTDIQMAELATSRTKASSNMKTDYFRTYYASPNDVARDVATAVDDFPALKDVPTEDVSTATIESAPNDAGRTEPTKGLLTAVVEYAPADRDPSDSVPTESAESARSFGTGETGSIADFEKQSLDHSFRDKTLEDFSHDEPKKDALQIRPVDQSTDVSALTPRAEVPLEEKSQPNAVRTENLSTSKLSYVPETKTESLEATPASKEPSGAKPR